MFQQIKALYIRKSHWKKEQQQEQLFLKALLKDDDYNDFTTTTRTATKTTKNNYLNKQQQKWRRRRRKRKRTKNKIITTPLTVTTTTTTNKLKQFNIQNNRSGCSCRESNSNGNGGHVNGPLFNICKLRHKMANTLSVMTNVLRNVVSKQRIRYKEKGFNLDLAYICDNIIAMGYPADNIEKIYRNRLEDVYKFLEENHHDHYKIYNLCLERSYDVNKFHGRVAAYPFEDHNPPTIELIQRFCADVDAWLKTDALNVAAVHCKAGKGRTGTMICCYLLYSNQQQTAEDALAYYDEKRTKDRKGVTIPSQRRYVQYFAKLLRSNLRYERRYLEFFEIRFTEAQLLYSQGTVHCAISALQDTCGCLKVQPLQNLNIDFRKSFTLDMKNFALRVSGDIKVELSHKTSKKKILHFWFNTYFVCDAAEMEGEGENAKLVYTLNKCEIDDAHKDKEHKMFSEDFKVQLAFYIESPINELNRSIDNHRSAQHSYVASTTRVFSTAVAASSVLTSNNSSSCDIQFICDQQTATAATTTTINTPKLLYNATTIVTAPITATNNYENVETKPYGNLNHLNDMTSSCEQRRPTSLINYNSPHKYMEHMQEHRRSEHILQAQQQVQQPQPQQQHELSSYSTQINNQQQPQQQQSQPHINMHKNNQQKMMIMHDNHKQTNIQNNCNSIHSQSNISNSSNSSINSHITSVSSSTSMASGGVGVGVTHEEIDKALNRQQENNEEEEDDEDDDDDEEEAEEDWESGESAVVKPLPSTTTTTTTTCTTINTTNNKNAIIALNNSKKLVIPTTSTTIITTTTTTIKPNITTTTNITTLKNTTSTSPSSSASYNTIHEAKNKQQTKHCYLHQMQSSSCYAKKIGDIVHKSNNAKKHKHYYDENVDDKHVDDDVDNNVNHVGDIVDDNVVGININNDYNHHYNNIDDNNDHDDAEMKAIDYRLNAVHIKQNQRNIAVTDAYNDDEDPAGQSTTKNITENNAETTTAIAKRSTRSNKLLMSNLAARYKIMHLLSAKASNKVMAPKHSYFKRKSLKAKSAAAAAAAATTTTAAATGAGTCSNNDCYMLAGAIGGSMEVGRDMRDVSELEQLRTRTTSVGNAGGCGGGVAGSFGVKASKLKLKMSFSKTNSKLKWTQKFHWLQNYVRSADAAVDLRKSCAQSTSSQRLNSQSSNGNGNSNTNINYNNVNGIKTTTNTTTTMDLKAKTISASSLLHIPQNASVGNSSLEDYYSSICDNQLSFNNSPCKSPPFIRNGSNCIDVVDAAELPSHMSNNANKVVVIAARPANIQAIGFNVMCKTSASSEATTTTVTATTASSNNGGSSNGSSGYATASTLYSAASIYDTPLTSFNADSDDIKISPFVFPTISAEITQLADVLKARTTTNRTQTTTTITHGSHAALGNGSLIKRQQHHDGNANDDVA